RRAPVKSSDKPSGKRDQKNDDDSRPWQRIRSAPRPGYRSDSSSRSLHGIGLQVHPLDVIEGLDVEVADAGEADRAVVTLGGRVVGEERGGEGTAELARLLLDEAVDELRPVPSDPQAADVGPRVEEAEK